MDNAITGNTAVEPPRRPKRDFSETEAVTATVPTSRTGAWFVAVEVITAVWTIAALLLWTLQVNVNPLDRVGQVSLLAGAHYRVALLTLIILAVAWVVGQVDRRYVDAILWPAAVSMASGLFGSVVAVAQGGTRWPIGADTGDVGQIRFWILDSIAGRGEGIPDAYPPLFPRIVEILAEWQDVDPASVLHHAQIAGVLAMSPIAYFAWRLIARPAQAAVFSVVTAANFIEPYKPYAALALIVMVPLLIAYVRNTRAIPLRSNRSNALRGALVGALMGIMTISYSGWLYWVAPGIVVLLVAVTPWRRQLVGSLVHHVAALAAYLIIAGKYIQAFLNVENPLNDTYFYFDTFVEPAYFAMWRGGQRGYDGPWPFFGELGGLGLASILLLGGIGAALAFLPRRSIVLVAIAMFVSSWIMRHRIAQHMWEDQAVQLYPRTTYMLYLAAIVMILAVLWYGAARIIATHAPGLGAAPSIGLFVFIVLLGTSAASASVDKHLPEGDLTVSALAWVPYTKRDPDGACPRYLNAFPDCELQRRLETENANREREQLALERELEEREREQRELESEVEAPAESRAGAQ